MSDNAQNKETITYLVTGGAGFIGTNFVKWLRREHGCAARIVVLDALTYAGNVANIADDIAAGTVFVHGDINDRALTDRVFAEHDPDFVVNFAAESHVDRSITGPRVFMESNVLGTQSLLESARAAWQLPDGSWRTGKRFLQISTDEVYGSLLRDYDHAVEIEVPADIRAVLNERKDTPTTFGKLFFTEDTPLSPRSPYSVSKAASDMLARAYHSTYGMPVVVTRCSNNYGPWQFPEKLIPLIINNILDGRELPVYGRGLNVRDWLYVDDHCAAIDTVLRKGVDGHAYNIGGFNEKQNIDIVREIVDLVADMTGTTPRHDLIRFVRDRAGHDMRYAIDPERTVRELGWYPRTPFSSGIVSTVRWYLDNIDWVRSVTSGAYRQYYKDMYAGR